MTILFSGLTIFRLIKTVVVALLYAPTTWSWSRKHLWPAVGQSVIQFDDFQLDFERIHDTRGEARSTVAFLYRVLHSANDTIQLQSDTRFLCILFRTPGCLFQQYLALSVENAQRKPCFYFPRFCLVFQSDIEPTVLPSLACHNYPRADTKFRNITFYKRLPSCLRHGRTGRSSPSTPCVIGDPRQRARRCVRNALIMHGRSRCTRLMPD